jgi:hypothetical protein
VGFSTLSGFHPLSYLEPPLSLLILSKPTVGTPTRTTHIPQQEIDNNLLTVKSSTQRSRDPRRGCCCCCCWDEILELRKIESAAPSPVGSQTTKRVSSSLRVCPYDDDDYYYSLTLSLSLRFP